MKHKIIFGLFCITAAFILMVLCKNNVEKIDSFVAMDTVVTLKIHGKESDVALNEIKKYIIELDSLHLSRFNKKSAVYTLNNSGKVTDKKLCVYLTQLADIKKKSAGAYSIKLGELSSLWSFTSSKNIPEPSEIQKALSNINNSHLQIGDDTVILSGNAVIDLGSAGKGIALDEAKKILKEKNISSALICVGGSILAYGNRTFKIGITKPFGKNGEYVETVSLKNQCISTSGSYERYFEKDGKLYHHILNPATGYPAESGVDSCSVISDSGLLSDALSTACFVLGKDKGTKLAAQYGATVIYY